MMANAGKIVVVAALDGTYQRSGNALCALKLVNYRLIVMMINESSILKRVPLVDLVPRKDVIITSC